MALAPTGCWGCGPGLFGKYRLSLRKILAITFHPKPGQVLYCDFSGYRAPEIVKARPVIVISPVHLGRYGLVTVVPLSTTAPEPVRAYHFKLASNPLPGGKDVEVWAKCDLVASVSLDRLDRVKVSRGVYQVGQVSIDCVKAIRRASLVALGVDLSNPSTYT
jgi:uncharacterized protein YifN (PemK superfamily)